MKRTFAICSMKRWTRPVMNDVASNGDEGLDRLISHKYDALVLDLRMPRKTGGEVLSIVRHRFPTLPVIVISGLARETDFQQTTGAFAFLKKPFQVAELLDAIRRATAR
ncbi:MAG: response regulator [bacterium]|jgi:CheY-like chemotaxis protein